MQHILRRASSSSVMIAQYLLLSQLYLGLPGPTGAALRHRASAEGAPRSAGSTMRHARAVGTLNSSRNSSMAIRRPCAGALCYQVSAGRPRTARQRLIHVHCQSEQTPQLGPRGPSLPERKPKQLSGDQLTAAEPSTVQTKRRRQRRGTKLPPPQPKGPTIEQSLASLLAYSGLTGTVAVVLGAAFQVDPFHSFSFDLHHIQLGLQFMLPIYVANCILLLPQYSSWELPSLASSKAAAPNSSSDTPADTTTTTSITSGSSRPLDSPAPAVVATTNSSSSSSRPAPSVITEPAFPDQLVKQLRSTLHFTQSHYLGSTVAGQLPLGWEAAVLCVECLAAEMLYRSVALQALGGWLLDRWYEAGWEGVAGPWAHWVAQAPDSQVAQGAALALLTGASGLLALQRMVRAAQRVPLMHALQQQLGAEQQQAGSGAPAFEAGQQDAAAGGAPGPQQQQVAAPLKPGALSPVGQLLLAASDAMVWSRGVQGLRDLSQFTALGLTYVATGNLAACYVAALLHELQMTVLQRHAREKLRERSIAFAAKLSEMNRRLRRNARPKRAANGTSPSNSHAAADASHSNHASSSSSSSSSDSSEQQLRGLRAGSGVLPPEGGVGGLQRDGAAGGLDAVRASADLMYSSSVIQAGPSSSSSSSRLDSMQEAEVSMSSAGFQEGAAASSSAAGGAGPAVSMPGVAGWDPGSKQLAADAVENGAMASNLEQTINALDSLLGQLEEQPAA